MSEKQHDDTKTIISSDEFDSLTGLKKYEYFVCDLKNIISENTDNPDFKLAIVYSDIRHFKYLNDTFGYNRGNELLKMYAEFSSNTHSRFLGNCHVYSDNFISAINIAGLTEENFYEEIINEIKILKNLLSPSF